MDFDRALHAPNRQGRTGGLDVWGNDLDAYVASWEDLVFGGRGIWYSHASPLDSVECTHEDETGIERDTVSECDLGGDGGD
jgi:hypothetical protein